MTMQKLIATLALLFCLFGVSRADEPPPRNKMADDQGFEPVAADMMDKSESIPANTLVGAAYGFIFAAVVVWVATVVARTRRVEEELDALRRKLDKGQ
jgi:ribose/xylose/arabinose/galactoside ABC-type transport system permease subunit